MKNDKPLVTIWCPTYNHVQYIQDAIEGFIMQKTNFSYEIIIHDDASTDGTTEILKKYEARYPELIRVIYQSENIYQQKERRLIMRKIKQESIRGKYVATCEGDDYWVDNNKLQKQIDYLEENEECCVIGHNVYVEDCQTGEKTLMNVNCKTGYISNGQIITDGVVLQTGSIVCRRECIFFEEWMETYGIGDYPMKLNALNKGKIYYFEQPMSVYRSMHSNSWTSNLNQDPKKYIFHTLRIIDLLHKYNNSTGKRYSRWTDLQANHYLGLFINKVNTLENDEIKEIYETLKRDENVKYVYLFDTCLRLREKMESNDYIAQNMLEFVNEYDSIVIWGAGKYSNTISEWLESKNINIQDYIVSSIGNKEPLFRGKMVKKVADVALGNDVGVVIAVRKDLYCEILEVVEQEGISNTCFPLIFLQKDFYN